MPPGHGGTSAEAELSSLLSALYLQALTILQGPGKEQDQEGNRVRGWWGGGQQSREGAVPALYRVFTEGHGARGSS